MSSEAGLERLIPAWLELTKKASLTLGLEPAEASLRAEDLLAQLRAGHCPATRTVPDSEQAEVLHALVSLICSNESIEFEAALRDVELTFIYISSLPWPQDLLGGPGDLLSRCAFGGWRFARRFAAQPIVDIWLGRLPVGDIGHRAERTLLMPLKERESELSSLEPELLLAILAILWNNADSTPSVACTEFEYFYRLLARQSRSIGPDGEREYLLSLFALGTGVGNRLLFRVAEAEDWLTRAEAHIALVHNDDALKARLQYQRLALSAERRRFAEVLDRAPSLAKAFERLKMPIDLLKTRLIEALALREIGLPNKGIPVMKQVFDGATFLDNLKLKAQSANGLTQLYRVVGDLDRALDWVSVTLPLLEQTKQTIGLAKLRWCFGDILREKGRPLEAMEAYTAALHDSENLGIRNDAVAIHLVLAEMLFEAYRPDEAFEHVRAALPIIDEEKMLPEAIAALSLLRESLRRRQIDKQALRELHGYFQDK